MPGKRRGELIQVSFCCGRDGKTKGEVTVPCGKYQKIVFPARNVPTPEPGEWSCRVIRDTKPDQPGRGALIVKPLTRHEPEWKLVPKGIPLRGAQRVGVVGVVGERELSDWDAPLEVRHERDEQVQAFLAACAAFVAEHKASLLPMGGEVETSDGKLVCSISGDSWRFQLDSSEGGIVFATSQKLSGLTHFNNWQGSGLRVSDLAHALKIFGQPQAVEQGEYGLILSWGALRARVSREEVLQKIGATLESFSQDGDKVNGIVKVPGLGEMNIPNLLRRESFNSGQVYWANLHPWIIYTEEQRAQLRAIAQPTPLAEVIETCRQQKLSGLSDHLGKKSEIQKYSTAAFPEYLGKRTVIYGDVLSDDERGWRTSGVSFCDWRVLDTMLIGPWLAESGHEAQEGWAHKELGFLVGFCQRDMDSLDNVPTSSDNEWYQDASPTVLSLEMKEANNAVETQLKAVLAWASYPKTLQDLIHQRETAERGSNTDRAEAKGRAQAIMEELKRIHMEPYSCRLPHELRMQLFRLVRENPCGMGTDGILHWIHVVTSTMEDLSLAEPEAKRIHGEEVAKEEADKAARMSQAEKEEAARLAEAKATKARIQEAGGLVNFTAWNRRSGTTNQGGAWVICPDGLCRQHDRDDVRRHKRDGNFIWDFIRPEELVIRFTKDCRAASHICEIVQLPIGGASSHQLDQVRRIEEKIGAPVEAFGFSAPSPPVAAPVNVHFTHDSKRDFRCSCGGWAKATKGQMKEFKAGKVIELYCPVCKGSGNIQN